MRTFEVTFRIPTGYIGADFEEEQVFSFEDDTPREDIINEIYSEHESWVENILEDLRMSAEIYVDGTDDWESEV